jgi:hypothetical protein
MNFSRQAEILSMSGLLLQLVTFHCSRVVAMLSVRREGLLVTNSF